MGPLAVHCADKVDPKWRAWVWFCVKCRFFVDPGAGLRNQIQQDWSLVAVFRASQIQSHLPLKCRQDRYHDLQHIMEEMEVREMKSFAQSHSASKLASQN